MTLTLLFETIFVGFYSICIFLFWWVILTSKYVSNIANNLLKPFSKYKIYFILFLTGFTKHYLGYYFGIHDYYCQHGEKCVNKTRAINRNLLVFSLIEGFVYMLPSMFLQKTTVYYNSMIIFCYGMMLHFVADKIGVHTFFCKEFCI